SEKVGAAKPSPKLLDYAIRDLGLTNRSRVLMVGDDLLADIKGGINAGIDTCWVNFANEENKTGIQPKYTVHSYEELYRVVMEPEELENVGVRNRRHMNEG
ncbi:HAD superfamily hydrolase, partial [human gut metagenome]